MNCEFYNVPFEHIFIKNTYSDEQLENIWIELDQIFPYLQTAEYTISAKDDDGQYKKKEQRNFLRL